MLPLLAAGAGFKVRCVTRLHPSHSVWVDFDHNLQHPPFSQAEETEP